MAYNRNFNLNNYETVKSRKTRLKKDYPNSLIMPIVLSDASQSFNYVLVGALIWKDKKTMEDLSPQALDNIQKLAEKATPQNVGIIMASIGILAKADSTGYSLSIAGGKGADNNAWVENAEESAVGRALDNMGYHSGSASKDEMEKVEHIQQAKNDRQGLENAINTLFMHLTQAGYKPEYISQICYQGIRPFQELRELSFAELEKMKVLLESCLNQNNQKQMTTNA